MLAGKRRSEITAFIEQYAAQHGQQTPSLQEIADGLAISKTTTDYHVRKLIIEGRARRHDNKLWLTQAAVPVSYKGG
jgi:SOS-response transcriptional repressor LexA